MGKESQLYLELGTIVKIQRAEERSGPAYGVDITFGKNRKADYFKEESDRISHLLLDGEITSGFVLSHKELNIYSLDDHRKFLE